MNLKNLQWAYTENEIRIIYGASKDENYFLDIENKIPLIYCKGEINKPYWRKEANIHDDIIREYFGSSESVEHYNTKMYFTYYKELNYKKYVFKAESSESEYYIKQINKRIDVMFFDVNKEPLLGIEVYKTNKKTIQDINKFEKLNFPIYEYNYNTKKGEFISFGGNGIKEIESIKGEIKGVNKLISDIKNRVRGADRHISVLQKGVELEKEKYFKEKEEIELLEFEIEVFKNEFNISREIKRVEEEIIGSGETIATQEEIDIYEKEWEMKKRGERFQINLRDIHKKNRYMSSFTDYNF